jgi:hypothetical protein
LFQLYQSSCLNYPLLFLFLHNVTDMLRVFLGGASVNTFPQLRNDKESGVFYVVPSCTALVAMQRCNNHTSAAANQHTTVEKAVFSACPALTSHDNISRGQLICVYCWSMSDPWLYKFRRLHNFQFQMRVE